MSGSALVVFLEVVSLLGFGLTAGKLFRSGLFRRYRAFFAYLVFEVLFNAVLLFSDIKSGFYFTFWVVTEPLVWLLCILMVLELYRLILEKHPGLYTLGRWVMYAALVISVTVSILSLLPKITPAMPQASKVMGYWLATERGVDSSLAIFIFLMLIFLSRYPVPLSRNVVVHAIVFSIFFLSNTVVYLARSLFGLHLIDQINLIMMAIPAVCVLAWLFLLNPQGEQVRAAEPSSMGPEHEERVLHHLNALNATLLRASRN